MLLYSNINKMYKSVKIKAFVIPQDFENIFNEFLILVNRDDNFQEMLDKKKTKDNKVDQRYKRGKDTQLISISIRYIISDYVRRRRVAELQKLKLNPAEAKKEDESSKDSNLQENSS